MVARIDYSEDPKEKRKRLGALLHHHALAAADLAARVFIDCKDIQDDIETFGKYEEREVFRCAVGAVSVAGNDCLALANRLMSDVDKDDEKPFPNFE